MMADRVVDLLRAVVQRDGSHPEAKHLMRSEG
jgi:hypothetical protein